MKIIKAKPEIYKYENNKLEFEINTYLTDECVIEGFLFKNEVLEYIEAPSVEFKNCIFENCKFTECSFQKSSFVNVIFKGCGISNCNFEESGLHRVEFYSCKLMGSGFPESSINNIEFKECDCRYLNFSQSVIKDVLFDNCNMSRAIISECKLSAKFDSCNMSEVSFFHTSLKGIDLTSCEILGISLDIPDLRGVVVNVNQAVELSKFLNIVIK